MGGQFLRHFLFLFATCWLIVCAGNPGGSDDNCQVLIAFVCQIYFDWAMNGPSQLNSGSSLAIPFRLSNLITKKHLSLSLSSSNCKNSIVTVVEKSETGPDRSGHVFIDLYVFEDFEVLAPESGGGWLMLVECSAWVSPSHAPGPACRLWILWGLHWQQELRTGQSQFDTVIYCVCNGISCQCDNQACLCSFAPSKSRVLTGFQAGLWSFSTTFSQG